MKWHDTPNLNFWQSNQVSLTSMPAFPPLYPGPDCSHQMAMSSYSDDADADVIKSETISSSESSEMSLGSDILSKDSLENRECTQGYDEVYKTTTDTEAATGKKHKEFGSDNSDHSSFRQPKCSVRPRYHTPKRQSTNQSGSQLQSLSYCFNLEIM